MVDRPPSHGTVLTVLWAVSNFKAFFTFVVPSIFSTPVHLTEQVSTTQTRLYHVPEEYEVLYWTHESGFDLTSAEIKEDLPTPSRSNSLSKFTNNKYKFVLLVVNDIPFRSTANSLRSVPIFSIHLWRYSVSVEKHGVCSGLVVAEVTN